MSALALFTRSPPSNETYFFLANVDWALINFMEDWFPEEAHVKLKQNEREATEEHLVEMGFDPNQKCVIM